MSEKLFSISIPIGAILSAQQNAIWFRHSTGHLARIEKELPGGSYSGQHGFRTNTLGTCSTVTMDRKIKLKIIQKNRYRLLTYKIQHGKVTSLEHLRERW
jgi:hypothetical protein